MDYIMRYLEAVKTIADNVDRSQVDKIVRALVDLREKGGRLFILGVGGSAANCGHAVNDFRKLAAIETYAPTDNVAELTARTNDEGWETVFEGWLKVSKISGRDAVLVFSVGGGNAEKNISRNLVKAVDLAKERGAGVYGVIGRDGGYTARNADACVIIPTVHEDMITPQAEGWQGVVWHMIVSDPRLLAYSNKWESMDKK